MADVRLGFLSIDLPTADEAQCCIAVDLREHLGIASNDEALARFRAAWRSGRGGKLELDSESASLLIHGGRDAIVEAALTIHELSGEVLDEEEVRRVRAAIRAHKRPSRHRWLIGDVFAAPLVDGSFGFGQVLWEQAFGAGFKGRAPTVALFEHRATSLQSDDPDLLLDEVVTSRTIAILHHPSDPLDTQRWKVVGNRPPASAPFSGPCGEPGTVGSVSGDQLEPLANRYFGLAPWNDAYKENYWDFFLMPGIRRPAAARLR